MYERLKRMVNAYITSAWIPLVVTLVTAVFVTVIIAWLQKHSVPEGTTFYDAMEDRSLVEAQMKYFELLQINFLTLLAMFLVGLYQLIKRFFLKGIINILLPVLLFMPLTLLSFGFLAMLRECQSVTVCGYVSDERALRYEFGIPDDVQLIDIYSPTATTFFGREGLTIDATFQFTPEQFNRYLSEQISTENGWEPLPVPQDLLWHIGRIEEYAKRYIEREYGVDETLEDQGEVFPTPGYLEAELRRIEVEHYEAFLQRLPPFPDSGYYSCRTAGTNVLYTTKTTCDDPDYINDFILATLDTTTLELYIKVSTYY